MAEQIQKAAIKFNHHKDHNQGFGRSPDENTVDKLGEVLEIQLRVGKVTLAMAFRASYLFSFSEYFLYLHCPASAFVGMRPRKGGSKGWADFSIFFFFTLSTVKALGGWTQPL